MSLREAISRVLLNPTNIPYRVELVRETLKYRPELSEELWSSMVRLNGGRGLFFPALFICRHYISSREVREKLLSELAEKFGANRLRNGVISPPPVIEPIRAEIPEDTQQQLDMAVKLALEIDELLLPSNAVLPEFPVFSELDKKNFIKLAETLEEIVVDSGETVIRENELDRDFFILASGSVKVTRQLSDGSVSELAILPAPDVVGEMALLSDVPRRATVTALEKSFFWKISEETVKTLTKEEPHLIDRLLEVIKKRLLSNLLKNSKIFQTEKDLEVLVPYFEVKTVPADTTVVKQGEAPPGLFVILHGEAEVWITPPNKGTNIRIAVLSEGDAFGEMSLLTGNPTTANIWMPDGGVLLYLPADKFYTLRKVVPKLEDELTELMINRKDSAKLSRDEYVYKTLEFELVDDSWIFEVIENKR